jgi:hypothetical protein
MKETPKKPEQCPIEIYEGLRNHVSFNSCQLFQIKMVASLNIAIPHHPAPCGGVGGHGVGGRGIVIFPEIVLTAM